MKVFLHTRSPGQRDWTNETYNFARVPVKGEYVAVKSPDDEWYLVELVVHTPFTNAEFDAEVYAVAVKHLDALEQELQG